MVRQIDANKLRVRVLGGIWTIMQQTMGLFGLNKRKLIVLQTGDGTN